MVVLAVNPSDPQAIAESLIPVQEGWAQDNRTKYLSFIACGFSIREAVKLAGIHQRTVMRWREEEDFRTSENRARGELRAQLASEHINMEFTRNYALVLQKDLLVFQKAVHHPDTMTKQEHEYLLRARNHYTPQQLQILQQLIKAKTDGDLSFTDVVRIIATRTREEVTIERSTNPNTQVMVEGVLVGNYT